MPRAPAILLASDSSNQLTWTTPSPRTPKSLTEKLHHLERLNTLLLFRCCLQGTRAEMTAPRTEQLTGWQRMDSLQLSGPYQQSRWSLAGADDQPLVCVATRQPAAALLPAGAGAALHDRSRLVASWESDLLRTGVDAGRG